MGIVIDVLLMSVIDLLLMFIDFHICIYKYTYELGVKRSGWPTLELVLAGRRSVVGRGDVTALLGSRVADTRRPE